MVNVLPVVFSKAFFEQKSVLIQITLKSIINGRIYNKSLLLQKSFGIEQATRNYLN